MTRPISWALIGKTPKYLINDHSQFFAFGEGQDSWTVANKTVPISHLKVGQNKITYYHTSGFGEFVEKPGPMIVLKRTSPVGADTRAPLVHRQNPLPGATYVDSGANVIAYIYDGGTGVDLNTIAMKVNGQTVGPTITGDKYSYRLAYDPPFNFSPGDTVQVKINACDLSGNCMSEASYSFTIKPPAVPATFVSDDFNTCELDSSIWTTYDPKNDATFEIVDAKRVKISVPGGVSHDIWTGGIKAPTIMQASNNGQVDLAAKFDSPMATAVQMQGILIKQDENDFIRVNFQNEGDGTRMMVAGFTNGVIGAKKNGLIGPGLPLYLRVERNELDWTAYYSYDGAEWYRFYDFQHEITVTEVGVFAGNAGATPPAFESVVDFFFNNDSPIDPQDTIGLILPVEVEGNGQVTKDRECGNPVELTAVSDPGWSFDSWLGSVIDGLTDSVVTAAFELNDVVTAIFTRDEYTLEVIKVYNSVDDTEGGSVTLDPEQPFYYYEDEVLVTAVSDPGWTFDGWSGALTGATAAQTLTMLQNESVTATFTQDQYEISYDIVGEGSVTIEPDGPYLYGDIVTLTAVPADGYYFASWAGGISSSDNPLEISVTSDLELTVTFTDNQPPTIDPIDDVELMIGEPLTIVVTAADTDGTEPLTFMADGLPPGATFVQTSATTAQLTWLPGCGDNGEHPILFTVSDGMTETYKNVLITVNGYGICTPLILGGPSS